MLVVVVGNKEVEVVDDVVEIVDVVVVVIGTEFGSTNSNLFGEPEVTPVITPLVALVTRLFVIVAGVADLFALSNCAAAPATCGLDIEVPEIAP